MVAKGRSFVCVWWGSPTEAHLRGESPYSIFSWLTIRAVCHTLQPRSHW
jgi:formylmethanofuran dehydrogenase subunit B